MGLTRQWGLTFIIFTRQRGYLLWSPEKTESNFNDLHETTELNFHPHSKAMGLKFNNLYETMGLR